MPDIIFFFVVRVPQNIVFVVDRRPQFDPGDGHDVARLLTRVNVVRQNLKKNKLFQLIIYKMPQSN
jgi:hypothetical protein